MPIALYLYSGTGGWNCGHLKEGEPMTTELYMPAGRALAALETECGSLRTFRKRHIGRALRLRNDDVAEAAALLGIAAPRLHAWMRNLEITGGFGP